MGYRSDVAYSISFRDEENMKKFIATAMAMQPNAVQALAECHISTEHHEINFSAEGVKWYDNYGDVQSHIALLDLVDDIGETVEAGYYFLRVGEDTDDNESKYGGDNNLIPWDNLYLVRQVSANMETTPNYDETQISLANIFGENNDEVRMEEIHRRDA